MAGGERRHRAHVEDLRALGWRGELLRSGCAPTNGPRLSSTMRSMFGGRGADDPGGLRDEERDVVVRQRRD